MKIGVSYARNPFLIKYMEDLRYIDYDTEVNEGIRCKRGTFNGI